MAEHSATVKGTRLLARDVLEVDFATEEPLHFRAGQFISLRAGEQADGTPIRRSYSIASPQSRTDGFVLIAKIIAGGPASAFLSGLEPGVRIGFTGPMGFFVLDPSHPADVVFAATGTGITPVLPMLADLLPRAEAGRVRVYWGCRNQGDLFWQDELAEVQRRFPRLELSVHLTQASDGWSGPRGRITDAVLDELPRLSQPVFYLVGNGDMIRELRSKLIERGVDRKKQTRTEAFFNT
jgi:ferredoxin-NADP reductase